jgi:3-hydroxy-5-methyl-1-naphthoate 3-O-methyltransferase
VPLGREPDPFLDSFTGLVAARALTTATVLGIFDVLHDGPLGADALAARVGLDPLGAETLLATLQALRYVECGDDGAFRNADVSERLLISSSPESIASFVGAQADLHWRVLDGLPGAVRDGDVYAMHEERQDDSPRWEAYMRGLFEISRRDHERDAKLVPLEAPRRLVDVAGGHGGFSMAMCRLHPELQATIVDLPPSAANGRKIVAAEGFSDRIDFREGDVFEIGLGDSPDVVSAFNLVHHLSVERNRELCEMARAALRPGGCLVIGDAAAPEEGEPVSEHGAISSLLFYAWSHSRNFTPSEIRGWMEDAGFEQVSVHRNLLSLWRVVVVGR